MADGISTLDALSYGTSTAGAASAGETSLTLGQDRQDDRTPPDLKHVWAAQLNAVKNLSQKISIDLKGGTRFGTRTQTASPFAANEQGWWIDTNGNPRFSYGGVANTLLSVAFGTKGDLITYTGSAVAVQGTGGAGNNGFVLTADSTVANGIKWAAAPGVSWPLTNGTSGNTYNSAVTDGAAAVGHSFDTTNAFATNGDFVFRIRSNAVSWFTAGRLNSQNAFTFTGSTDANGAGPIFVTSAASNAGVTLDATGGGGRKFTTYSTTGGLWVLADLTAAANRWQMDVNGAFAPFADNAYNLGLPSTNRVGGVYTVRTEALRFTSPTQSLGFSATPAINATSGGVIHIGPITANVTGPTMTGGVAGERCSIIWLKDGTAGTFTIAGWGANVRVNGTATFAAGANAIIVQSFLWDDRLGTPAWVLQSQQAVV